MICESVLFSKMITVTWSHDGGDWPYFVPHCVSVAGATVPAAGAPGAGSIATATTTMASTADLRCFIVPPSPARGHPLPRGDGPRPPPYAQTGTRVLRRGGELRQEGDQVEVLDGGDGAPEHLGHPLMPAFVGRVEGARDHHRDDPHVQHAAPVVLPRVVQREARHAALDQLLVPARDELPLVRPPVLDADAPTHEVA